MIQPLRGQTLRRVTAAGRRDVVPLIVLSAEQVAARPATATREAMTAAQAFAHDIHSIWGTAPFFLDASGLGSNARGTPLLRAIASRARILGCQLIPATFLDAPAAYQNAVSHVANTDLRGVALRVDLQELTGAASWVRTWGHSPRDTDLITDFGENVGVVASLGGSLINAFQSLHRATHWRTVALSGTSMPQNFTGYAAGVHTIRREEWLLWQSVEQAVTNYDLDYGDYTTVSPSAPPPGIKWGFPINVRYTTNENFIICRGVKTTGPLAASMQSQLIRHARSIVARPDRNALAHCWADTKIDEIAAGTDTPGGLEMWVVIGVNRHIELTRHLLP